MITEEMKRYIELMNKPVVNVITVTTMEYNYTVLSHMLKLHLTVQFGTIIDQMSVSHGVNELQWCPMGNVFVFWKTNEDRTFTWTVVCFEEMKLNKSVTLRS